MESIFFSLSSAVMQQRKKAITVEAGVGKEPRKDF